MFAFQSGFAPVASRRAVLCRSAIIFSAFALAGCASNSSTSVVYQYPGDARIARPQHLAAAVVEVEADGLPAQTPPSARLRPVPDDPSEPWSRNYGGANPSRVPIEVHDDEAPPLHKTPDKSRARNIPQDLPPQFRKQLAAAVAASDDE